MRPTLKVKLTATFAVIVAMAPGAARSAAAMAGGGFDLHLDDDHDELGAEFSRRSAA